MSVLLCYCNDDTIARLLVEKCSFKLELSMLVTAALCTFTFYFESNFKNAVTFYFYISKPFGLYFYFCFSKKMIKYLHFYSSTQGQYFLQHCS